MAEVSSSHKDIALVDEVKEILRGLKYSDISCFDDAVRLNVRGTSIIITHSEVDSYRTLRAHSFQETETSVFCDGYYEQAVEVHGGQGPNSYRLFKVDRTITLKHEQTGFKIELSPLSSSFVMKMHDSDSVSREFRNMSMYSPAQKEVGVSLQEYFRRFLSIKVFCSDNYSLRRNVKQLKLIAEAGLYHISYGSGVALIMLNTWERSLFRLPRNRTEEVQFPLCTYNQELVAYYQMALGAESLVLAYLALYKILEYFYTDASEHVLHGKIKEHLLAPDFSHSKVKKVRQLVQVIRSFDNKMNEKAMLQTVLEQHLDKADIRSWLETHEADFGESFTVDADVFGKMNRVDLSDNQIFPTLSTRIYHIRNALVHNKEGEESRFTPFSGQEKNLLKEVSLLLKIAENLIHRTAKDLSIV